MEKIEFTKEISASAEKVWTTLLGKKSYPKWTSVFAEGSSVETDWKKGSKAIFGDGTGNGMVSRIEENIPLKFLSIKHLGEIKDGKEDLDKNWGNAYENYTLAEKDGHTKLTIELNISSDWKDYMKEIETGNYIVTVKNRGSLKYEYNSSYKVLSNTVYTACYLAINETSPKYAKGGDIRLLYRLYST